MPQQQKANRLALRSRIIMSILLIFLWCLHSNSVFVNHVVFQREQPDFQEIYPTYCTFFNAQFIIFHCTSPSVLAHWSNWTIQVLYGLGIMKCRVPQTAGHFKKIKTLKYIGLMPIPIIISVAGSAWSWISLHVCFDAQQLVYCVYELSNTV